MRTNYTRVWKINGTLVVARQIEDAIALYKKHRACFNERAKIQNVELVKDDNHGDDAVLSVEDEPENDVA